MSNNGTLSPVRVVSGRVTHVTTKLPISNAIRFRIRANTPWGETSRWAASADFNVCIYEETDPDVRLVGTFVTEGLPGSSHGTVKWATHSASARFSFTGSSVAFVSTYGPDRGIAMLKIDGVKAGRVNLYGPQLRAGRIVWTHAVSDGPHVLAVVVKGKHSIKSTGSRVDIDGFLTSGVTTYTR